jgi:hypothetical protein
VLSGRPCLKCWELNFSSTQLTTLKRMVRQRVSQCLELYLRCDVNSTPRHWTNWLSLAELWYNSAHHASLKCSPFKALYGVEPSIGLLPDLNNTVSSDATPTLEERHQFLELLRQQLARAQNKMKLQVDTKRSERHVQVGKLVLLKLQPYTQTSVARRPCPKLAFKYYGPYAVLEKIGSMAYKLELPTSSQIHPDFHVSQLKSFTPDHQPVFSELPSVPMLDTAQVEPELILDRRLTYL